MTLIFRALAAAFGLVAMPMPIAYAQETGTLLTKPAAQISGRGKVAARQTMRQLTQCLVSRTGGRIDRYLSLPVDGEEFNRMSQRLFDREGDECMSDGSIQFPIDLMRGSLYEATYVRDFRNRGLTNFADVPPIDYAAGYAPSPSGRAANAIALVRFGDCVARTDGVGARSVVFSIPGSSGESSLFAQLAPKFGTCLPKGVQFQFSKTILRGALAEGLYRLSRAAKGMGQ